MGFFIWKIGEIQTLVGSIKQFFSGSELSWIESLKCSFRRNCIKVSISYKFLQISWENNEGIIYCDINNKNCRESGLLKFSRLLWWMIERRGNCLGKRKNGLGEEICSLKFFGLYGGQWKLKRELFWKNEDWRN